MVPQVFFNGTLWSHVYVEQPRILRVYGLPQAQRYDLQVVWNGSQPEMHLTSSEALSQSEKQVPAPKQQKEAQSIDIEQSKQRLAVQEHRWEHKVQALQEQVQQMEADEAHMERSAAALHQAITEAEMEAAHYEQEQKQWAHLLQERKVLDASAAALEQQTLHKLEQEAAEAEQALQDTQRHHNAVQSELRQLEAQYARQQAVDACMWRLQERRPSPMQVHSLQWHRRTASLRESTT
ncbi:hypothetical protein MEQU1_002967 [Malassezia equina]|uniref:Uncharacterized protein n=1 Tax=Malassezia equina TaxID=1381935 RepID=A0AAF0EEM5_9BASI|nr:hypothetical protein MEQU1_002967 [Malassezia equina]